MARKQRLRLPNITYHVYSRCIEWRNLMERDSFKDLFLEVLKQTGEKYRFDLNFYEIMDNHFHLIIKTREDEADISRIMQYLKARFAERFNRKTGKIGPFWNERFRDVIVEEKESPLEYFLYLLWYLAFNPVRKGMVKDPREYPYGSLTQYLREEMISGIPVVLHEYYLVLGNTLVERVDRLLEYGREWFRMGGI